MRPTNSVFPRRLGSAAISVLLAGFALILSASESAALDVPTSIRTTENATSASPHVLVLGVRGADWTDVSASQTPGLTVIAAQSAIGTLALRSGSGAPCVAESWVVISTGTRALAADCPDAVGAPGAAGRSVQIPDFAELVTENAAAAYAAQPGALADFLRTKNICVTAVGPLAALGAADVEGRVAHVYDDPRTLTAAQIKTCGVTLVDVPALPEGDVVIRDILDRAVSDASLAPNLRVLIVGTGTGSEPLGLAAFLGAPYASGLLTAPNIERPPYLQLIDVAPTIARNFVTRDAELPAAFVGAPASFVPADRDFAARLAAVREAGDASTTRARVFGPFVAVLLGTQVLGWLLLALAWRRDRTHPTRRRTLALAGAGLALAGVLAPASSFLASLARWPTSRFPLLLLVGATLGATVVLVAAAARSRPRRVLAPVGAATTVAAGVLIFDVVLGSRLQMNGALGYDAVTAGRFRGLGNLGFGLLAATGLLALCIAAARYQGRRRLAVLVLGGAALTAVVGAPSWGADAGGTLALLVGLVVVVLRTARGRFSLVAALVAAALPLAIVAGLAVADAARANPTHLGRFVESLGDGDAGTIIRRRLAANVELWTLNPGTFVVPMLVLAAVYLLLRPPPAVRSVLTAEPMLREAGIAIAVVVAIGVLINDSGISVAAGALLVTPAAIGAAAAYRWLAEQDSGHPDAMDAVP